MKWFKFYGQDWNTDPKIAAMSMEDRLCLVTLLTIASAEDKDGFIPSLTEESLIAMARIPYWPESNYNPLERAVGVMERLKTLRIVTEERNGGITVCNFKKRQGENLSNAERQKRYRERLKQAKNNKNYHNNDSNDSNGSVTTDVTLDKIREEKIRNNNTEDSIIVIESIKKRSADFILQIKEFYKGKTLKPSMVKTLQEFASYWTEPNKSGTKLRWELEKTWDLGRRLNRWMNNPINNRVKSKSKFNNLVSV